MGRSVLVIAVVTALGASGCAHRPVRKVSAAKPAHAPGARWNGEWWADPRFVGVKNVDTSRADRRKEKIVSTILDVLLPGSDDDAIQISSKGSGSSNKPRKAEPREDHPKNERAKP